jgi:hypothetical protein
MGSVPESNASPVGKEEDCILHSHHRENLKYYVALAGWALWRRSIVFCEVRTWFLISEYGIVHSHRCENLKPYGALTGRAL